MKLLSVSAFAVSTFGLAACGSDDAASASISGAWARTTAEGQTSGAVYMDITMDDDDTLVAASVPASVAGEAQIHEVVPAESGDAAMEMSSEMSSESSSDMSGSGMDTQMTMRELEDGLVLPAGETVTLEPGGYHIMLLDLVEPLAVGDEIEVTLDFENAESTTLTVEVAESAP